MAIFGKFANLSPKGWNAGTATQTIAVGKNAHIGLWEGEGLEVKSVNPTICVIHEEPRPRGSHHWRHFLLTAP